MNHDLEVSFKVDYITSAKLSTNNWSTNRDLLSTIRALELYCDSYTQEMMKEQLYPSDRHCTEESRKYFFFFLL